MKSLVITTKITARESEAFKKYLREVAEIETFEDANEEKVCAIKAYNGDEEARQELIRKNLRFVISVAKQYIVNGVTLEDLVNEGNIGITKAANRFDPMHGETKNGNKFISYAVWYIRKEITSFLNSHSRTIRLPNNKVDAVSKYKKRMSELEQILQREVFDTDMLEAYSDYYTKDDIEILNELTYNDISSLDMPVGEDGATLSQLLCDSSLGGADDLVIKSDMEININSLLSALKPVDRHIVTKLNGLDGESVCTLADVGAMFGISRESVRQRRDKAYRQIKNRVTKDRDTNASKNIKNFGLRNIQPCTANVSR